MRPGPPKKPSVVNALHGNPGKRAVNADEPRPDALPSVAAPAWLKADARDTWNALAPELHRLGLLTIVDQHALAGACRWWAIYRNADKKLSRALTAKTPSNGRQAAPEFAISARAFDLAMSVFSRFGITPAERTGLHAPQPKDASDGVGDQPRDPHDELEERRRARQRPTA